MAVISAIFYLNNMLKGKKILLCITGSIAAYKSVFLLRLLKKHGAEVKVIMTKDATHFVSELTFSTLSGSVVLLNLFDNNNWHNHAVMGRWADVMIIAPASSNTIAKLATGICDNLLTAVYLSATCPVMVAPAMDEDMWHHPATKRNIQKIKYDKVKVLEVEKGELASGLIGEGRMMEPEDILKEIENIFRTDLSLIGKKVLITSGPTYEPIDPVRFIGNRSSGKMGTALAESFAKQGADVTVVSGPSKIEIPESIKVRKVTTAQEMYDATMSDVSSFDIIVMAAAVADFTPKETAKEKIKKMNAEMFIQLKQTKDILLEAGQRKRDDQLLVGFALETENEKTHAIEKLKRKNADYIILNSLRDESAGFESDHNKISIFGKDGSEHQFPLQTKKELADAIVSFLIQHL